MKSIPRFACLPSAKISIGDDRHCYPRHHPAAAVLSANELISDCEKAAALRDDRQESISY